MAAPLTSRQRAQRYGVTWPVRIRRVNETHWHPAKSVNLSVTGILLHMARPCRVGEHVELEIDFLAQPEMKTTIRGVGHVVREGASGSAAIQFDVNASPAASFPPR